MFKCDYKITKSIIKQKKYQRPRASKTNNDVDVVFDDNDDIKRDPFPVTELQLNIVKRYCSLQQTVAVKMLRARLYNIIKSQARFLALPRMRYQAVH